jgi:hypothetical protein
MRWRVERMNFVKTATDRGWIPGTAGVSGCVDVRVGEWPGSLYKFWARMLGVPFVMRRAGNNGMVVWSQWQMTRAYSSTIGGVAAVEARCRLQRLTVTQRKSAVNNLAHVGE